MVISGIFLERLRERRARNRKALAEIEELEKRNGEFRKQEERARAEGEEWGRIRAERDSLKARVEQLEEWAERYQAAIAENKQFDEPMPASNGEDRSEEHLPMR